MSEVQSTPIYCKLSRPNYPLKESAQTLPKTGEKVEITFDQNLSHSLNHHQFSVFLQKLLFSLHFQGHMPEGGVCKVYILSKQLPSDSCNREWSSLNVWEDAGLWWSQFFPVIFYIEDRKRHPKRFFFYVVEEDTETGSKLRGRGG